MGRPLMLVSASADGEMRHAVAEGRRPRPEFLALEADHGVELLDWSRLPLGAGRHGRSGLTSLVHVASALSRSRRVSALFSDGEHLGIPMALALRLVAARIPHLVLGHNLTAPAKRAFFRRLHADRGMTRILVHSERQRSLAVGELGIAPERLHVIPYVADTAFWQPRQVTARSRLVVTAGLEHRDYRTLVDALPGLQASLVAAVGSAHSPQSSARLPEQWPVDATIGYADYEGLRDHFAAAAVIVVPVVETDFQAGITTALEAMAMARPVIVSETRGLRGLVRDGETGLVVPPGDPAALHRAIARLLDDPALGERLGREARQFVKRECSLARFAARLADHLDAISDGSALATATR